MVEDDASMKDTEKKKRNVDKENKRNERKKKEMVEDDASMKETEKKTRNVDKVKQSRDKQKSDNKVIEPSEPLTDCAKLAMQELREKRKEMANIIETANTAYEDRSLISYS